MTPPADPYEGVDLSTLDLRAHPELYRVGRGEQGVLRVQPYKDELLPLWRFRTPEVARESATAIRSRFDAYLEAGDLVGADVARKYGATPWQVYEWRKQLRKGALALPEKDRDGARVRGAACRRAATETRGCPHRYRDG